MKKISILCMLFVALFLSCAGNKAVSKKTNVSHNMEIKMPDSLKAASNFKRFYNDFVRDMEKADTPYIPSAQFLKKYDLPQINGKTVVKGFMQVSDSFKPEKAVSMGGFLTNYTDTTIGYSVPLEVFSQFVRLEGITYIELSVKVKIIKPIK